ncbi:hypothetical protein AMELA_G00089910 [Ameiurus melas]|uniref:Ig-like domain-containing protein n=1 Tax=Ameiurus melas TaxID=219545 RepID=A0A7J6AVP4_AMEME|nr:hypothetical protein AMELA_G00089910 [Ameiurus melas]
MVNDGRSLVYFLFLFSVDYVYSEDLKTGTNYTFRPSIQGTIEILDWRHNGNLVVEWEPGSDPHFYRYKERASLDTTTGDFTLRLMKKEDSGVFRGQFQVETILQEFERTITVIDPVPKPKVTCEQNGMNITLRCSVDPSVQAEFTWSGPNGFSESGNSVHITKESDQEKVYFCIAKNSVSHTDTEFNLNMCPHKGGQGGDGGDGGSDGPNTIVIVIVIVILVLVLGLAIAVYVFWGKIKDFMPALFPGATAGGTSREPRSNGECEQPLRDVNNTSTETHVNFVPPKQDKESKDA